MNLGEEWSIRFPLDELPAVSMPKLVSWTESENKAVKYHSGTAIYQKIVEVSQQQLSGKKALLLDLGNVEVIAKVLVNGVDCGIAWKTPYQVDVTDALQAGTNTIEITVANLWVNRILGDQQYSDDLEWTDDTGSTAAGQGLKNIPNWTIQNTTRPSAERKTFYAWKWPHLTKDKELLPSGLLGPVKLIAKPE